MKKIVALLLLAALLMTTMATVDAACTNKIGVKVVDWFNKPVKNAWVVLDGNNMPGSVHYTDANGYTSFTGVTAGKTHRVGANRAALAVLGVYNTKSVYVNCGASFPVVTIKI
jgi:hypothetical protein